MGNHYTIELTGLAHGGQAFGWLSQRIIFVPYGAPGDRVLVELQEQHRGWASGRILEIKEASEHRVQPPCPYFGLCQGCDLQHISYKAQLSAKGDVVRDQLERLGQISDAPIRPVMGMESPWRYRNQARLYPVSGGGLGIKAGRSSEAVLVEGCMVFHPLLDELFAALDIELEGLRSVSLRAGTATGEQMIIFEYANDLAPVLEVDLPISVAMAMQDGDVKVLVGNEWLWEQVASRRWRISALSPFPPNTAMAAEMVNVVTDLLEPRGEELLLDVGCGVGLFGLSLSDACIGLVGVEENPWAVGDFLENAANREKAGIIEGALIPSLGDVDTSVDLAIISSIRKGIGQEGAAHVARLSPKRIVYIAENPATLARDVTPLRQAGYELTAVQPMDLLPQTHQITVIARWEQRAIR